MMSSYVLSIKTHPWHYPAAFRNVLIKVEALVFMRICSVLFPLSKNLDGDMSFRHQIYHRVIVSYKNLLSEKISCSRSQFGVGGEGEARTFFSH